MIFQDTSKSNIFILALALIGIAVSFTSFGIITYIVSILLGSLAIFHQKQSSIGTLTSIFLTFLVITCFQQIAGMILWICGLTIPFAAVICFVIIAEFVYIMHNQIKIVPLKTNRAELISAAIAFISIALLSVGLLKGDALSAQLTRIVTRGFDSSTHLSLVMSTYNTQGYVYGPAGEVHDNIVFASLTSYPQGWHLVTSNIWRMMSNTLSFSNTTELLYYFYATVAVWYFILIFAISRLVAETTDLIRSRVVSTPVLAIGVLSVVLLIESVSTLSLMRYGFYNYIGLIIYILAVLLLATFRHTQSLSAKPFYILGIILTSGSFFTWLLAAPIGFFIVFANLFQYVSKESALKIFKRRLDFFPLIFGTVTLVFCSLVQVYLQMKYSTIENNIAAETIIWSTNFLLISFLSVIVFGVCFSASLFKSPVSQKSFLYTYASVLIVPAALYIFLMTTEGHSGYYFEKIGAIVTLVLLIAAGGIGLAFIGRTEAEYGKFSAIFMILAVVLSAPMIFGIDIKELKFAAGKDWTTSSVTAHQINNILASNTGNQNNVYIVKEIDYEEDVISTHFMNVVSQKETTCSSAIGWNQIIRSKDTLAGEIIRCAGIDTTTTYQLLVSKSTYPYWQNKVGHIKNINLIVND